jgi:hypothetical protein
VGTNTPSQIGDLSLPDDASMAIGLALDLVLKHAAGFGQWADDDKDLTAVCGLAHLGREADLLTDRELVGWHNEDCASVPALSS